MSTPDSRSYIEVAIDEHSGPSVTYRLADESDRRRWRVPKAIFDRYNAASDEFYAAENALSDAIDAVRGS